jgi:hypothetical protein
MAEDIKEELSPEQLNSAKLDELLKNSRAIKKYMRWQNYLAIARLLIIVIPLVLGFIFLPPLLKNYFQTYKSLLTQ